MNSHLLTFGTSHCQRRCFRSKHSSQDHGSCTTIDGVKRRIQAQSTTQIVLETISRLYFCYQEKNWKRIMENMCHRNSVNLHWIQLNTVRKTQNMPARGRRRPRTYKSTEHYLNHIPVYHPNQERLKEQLLTVLGHDEEKRRYLPEFEVSSMTVYWCPRK